LYGGVTDNAPNVVQACRSVLNCQEQLLGQLRSGALEEASQRIWLVPRGSVYGPTNHAAADAQLLIEESLSLDAAERDAAPRPLVSEPVVAAVDVEEPEPAADADAEGAGDDDSPLPVSDLDASRAHQCYLHDQHLMVMTALTAVPAMCATVAKVDRLVAAVSKSTVRQQQLRRALLVLGLKPLQVVKRTATRWNSLFDMLDRFLSVYPGLCVLAAKGSFESCASFIAMPSDGEHLALQRLVEVLRPIKIVSKVLQTTTNAMAFLPHITMDLYEQLASQPHELNTIVAFKVALRQQLTSRLSKHYSDATQPSLLAAMLHPCTAPFLLDSMSAHFAGLGAELRPQAEAHEILKAAVDNLNTWIDDAFADADAAASVDDGDEPKRARFAVGAARPVHSSRTDDMKRALSHLIDFLDSDTARRVFPRARAASESLSAATAALRTFYKDAVVPAGNSTVSVSILRPLVQMVMSLSPVSGGAERSFSATGRINAPLRNRLAVEMIEALTVIQFYLANERPDLKLLAARVVKMLEALAPSNFE